ncbi:septal ring lytic transglycosylase RlpA family protein [Elizabethkingia sp. JS20170427COW]|uniref:septal ring lytic transglycosylase RlpA family protein n=1 Tax=Elizabethkingia sp. JS20170427COW TaxID=2583851 RepID=UPI00111078AC|nr:septal ring lytic transglycosylase RlpA family protein [Elizabethkingia sp. JS20170427COW]QCX52811.1 septal ring lytic transglycosylase RlpA family protein [Elizabethkingia sp. JS20170427COW]
MQRIVFILFILFTVISSFRYYLEDEEKITWVTYYHDKFNGAKTSNGNIFDNSKYTAAHASLPFGTKVLLTNLATSDTVTVTVNDRGARHKKRAFDITKAAFLRLGEFRHGSLKVSYKIVE